MAAAGQSGTLFDALVSNWTGPDVGDRENPPRPLACRRGGSKVVIEAGHPCQTIAVASRARRRACGCEGGPR